MNTLKLCQWIGFPWKFWQLKPPRALAVLAEILWCGLPRIDRETKAAPREVGLRAKAANARSPSRLSSSKISSHHGRSAESTSAAPLRFVSWLLFSDVRLEREGKNLILKLAAKASIAQHPAPVDKITVEALTLRAALKSLLDAHSMTRRVMRHLAFFEGALAIHGLRAMSEVPVEVISVAVEQLEALVSNWSNPGLAGLRSKMAVAIVDRSRDPFYGVAGDKLSDFNTDSRLVVGDASHSMFLELERQYQDLLPAHSIHAVLDPIKVEFVTAAQTASGARSK
jgi:hypothetical protein